MLQKLNHRQRIRKKETWISCQNQTMIRCHPVAMSTSGETASMATETIIIKWYSSRNS